MGYKLIRKEKHFRKIAFISALTHDWKVLPLEDDPFLSWVCSRCVECSLCVAVFTTIISGGKKCMKKRLW